MSIKKIFKLKEVHNIKDINNIETSEIHKEIINKKYFLKKIYIENYNFFKNSIVETENKTIVELGSGGGFIKEIIPNIITSDVIEVSGVDMFFSALNMPFENQSVDAIVMIDVLHHIHDAEKFFEEADRCLKNNGKIIMIEPANTLWGRFIYKNFHHEPFNTKSEWKFESDGPMSSANGALPWILFYRDRKKFDDKFPNFQIKKLTHHTPFRYLVSGGVSMKQLLPNFCYGCIKGIEYVLKPLNNYLGMFMTIEIKKISNL